jgi:outer membrane protein assembly factor BamB
MRLRSLRPRSPARAPRSLAAARVAPGLLALVAAVASCGGSAANSTPAGASRSGASAATASAATGATAPAGTAAIAVPDWLTYHRDLARTGLDPTSPPLGRVRHAWTHDLDGKLYAEPLVSGGRVIVATEADSLYALRARDGRTLWRAQLGAAVSGGSLPCGNIDPTGITGTPAIDARTRTVYVVAFLSPARHFLFAVNLATGRVRWRRPIDPPGADPRVHQQRAALALSRGRVYVAYGGLYGDCGDYHGWVVSVPAGAPSGSLQGFRVPTRREGAIWAPSGPAVDAAGNLFVATGNGASETSFDFGNAVIRLTPGLARADFFAPRDAPALSAADTDLGSTGPVLLPGGRAFVIGKSGVGYLLDARHLGGIEGELDARGLCDAAFGGSAYARGLLYLPCVNGLTAVRATRSGLGLRWRGPGFRAGPPTVAGGAVWTVDLDGGTLYALDARSGRVRFSAGIGSPAQFTSPTVTGGYVFVGGGARVLAFRGA